MVPPRKSQQAQANGSRRDTRRLPSGGYGSVVAANLPATRNWLRPAAWKSTRGAWASGTLLGVWNPIGSFGLGDRRGQRLGDHAEPYRRH
jgi:hypothetical protein